MLKELVIHFGSQAKLAKVIGVTQPYMCSIIKGKSDFPTLYALKIEKITQGKFTVEMLLSDKKKKYLSEDNATLLSKK